jgi:O-antigen/teichoic acid export membrane protein
MSGMLVYSIVLALFLWLAIGATSIALPPLAGSELAHVLPWLAASLVLAAPASQYRALLQRHLRFAAMAQADIGGAIVSLATAVLAAAWGFGVFALVFAALSASAASCALLIFRGWELHRPRLAWRLDGMRPLLRFGGFQVAAGSIGYVYSQLDVLLIGTLLSTGALGQYTLAKQLCQRPVELFNPMVLRAALPILARLQDDRTALRRYFLDALRVISSLGFPLFFALIVTAEPLVVVLFGYQWQPAVPLVQWLAAAACLRSFGNPTGTLLLASGRVERTLRWELAMLLLLPAILFVGSGFGVQGTAAAIFLMYLGVLYPMWRFLVQPACGATFLEWVNGGAIALVLATAASVAAWLAGAGIQSLPVRLAVQLLMAAAVYVPLSFTFNRRALELARAMW